MHFVKIKQVFHFSNCISCSVTFSSVSVAEMGVSVYAVDPGLVKTDIIRHLKKSLQLFVKTRGFLIQTPAEGAYNTLYCALTPDLPTGIYYRFVTTNTADASHAHKITTSTAIFPISSIVHMLFILH